MRGLLDPGSPGSGRPVSLGPPDVGDPSSSWSSVLTTAQMSGWDSRLWMVCGGTPTPCGRKSMVLRIIYKCKCIMADESSAVMGFFVSAPRSERSDKDEPADNASTSATRPRTEPAIKQKKKKQKSKEYRGRGPAHIGLANEKEEEKRKKWPVITILMRNMCAA